MAQQRRRAPARTARRSPAHALARCGWPPARRRHRDRGGAACSRCGSVGFLMRAERRRRFSAARRRAASRVSTISRLERRFGRLRVGRAARVGQHHGGRRRHPRLRVLEVPPHQASSASSVRSAASARTAAARTSASGSFSMRSTAGSHRSATVGPRRLERGERARPHLRRLVMQQQRRDQVPLVERLEHVDGVQHATTRRGSTAPRRAFRSWPHRRRRAARPPAPRARVLDALPERLQVLAARAIAMNDPQARSPRGSRSSAAASRGRGPTA